MNDINNVNIIGRLTADPVLKYTHGGTAIADFSIANNSKYKEKESVSFFKCTAFGTLADIISKYLHKGSRVGIIGRLVQQRWEDNTGKAQSRVEIVINTLQMLDGKPSAEGQAVNNIPDDPDALIDSIMNQGGV